MTATRVRRALRDGRQRMLDLLDRVDDDQLRIQHSPLMSPLVWDLTHVGNYEELWLVRALGAPSIRPEIDELYDAFKQPRADRPDLPLLDRTDAMAYLAEVRSAAEQLLDTIEPNDDNPLCREHFVHTMVAQHEQQHIETVLATLQLMAAPGYRPARTPVPAAPPGVDASGEVQVPSGPFTMGTDACSWVLDNERPAHRVDLDAYWIDVAPVTNAAYLAFIDAGGYDQAELWHPDGWAWRLDHDLIAPQFWTLGDDGWTVGRFGHVDALVPDEPVQHVCWYEADAYARWAGRRLPTEAEWEKAAAWDPATDTTVQYPWGDDEPDSTHANLNADHFGPAPVGAYPAGASAVGCHQMLGDVWEWTSSDFHGYPGFHAFPYREYSEVFFGERFKVLRGGSWATDPVAARATFRNWDFPIRRQIFAGFRTARDG